MLACMHPPHNAAESTPVSTPPPLARKFGPLLESAWVSLRGTGHDRNQDAVLVAQPVFAVADGVGGGSAGELASSKLLEYCRSISPDIWHSPELLSRSLVEADEVLLHHLRAHTKDPSATTFAGAWLDRAGRGLIAHVGDARIIRLIPRHGHCEVRALTQDQTYDNMGEVPPPGVKAGDPARMLGVGAVGVPPVQKLSLHEGELLLLCTDGLHRFINESELAELCHSALRKRESLASLARALAQAARLAGSHDDISILILRRNPWLHVRWPFWFAVAATVVVWCSVVLLAPLLYGKALGF